MDLPWSDEQARWVFQRAATLAGLGAEPVGPIVLPDATFFPDRFDRSPASLGALWERMLSHVGLSEVESELLLVDAEEGRVVSSCSSGGCGGGAVKTLSGDRVSESKGGAYTVSLATAEVGHPVVVTTVLARAVGQVFLREADGLRAFRAPERAGAADLAASMLGLGVLIANGSGIEVKGCGGVKVHSATALPPPEAVLALAIVCERAALKQRGGAAELEQTRVLRGLDRVPLGLFALARTFVARNRDVVRLLDDAPDALAKGQFVLKVPRPSLGGRILGVLGVGKRVDEDPLAALEREVAAGSAGAAGAERKAHGRQGALGAAPRDAAREQRLAEIRALVDESFGP